MVNVELGDLEIRMVLIVNGYLVSSHALLNKKMALALDHPLSCS